MNGFLQNKKAIRFYKESPALQPFVPTPHSVLPGTQPAERMPAKEAGAHNTEGNSPYDLGQLLRKTIIYFGSNHLSYV